MATSFEIHLLRETLRGPGGSRTRLFLETMPETDAFMNNLLKPFGRSSFELVDSLSVSFRHSKIWPWAIVAFEREYQLAGHISELRRRPQDVAFSSYSVQPDSSEAVSGPPPVSMLCFRSKAIAAALASQSPLFPSALFAACWSVLADKEEDRHWLCVPDRLPEGWVAEAEREDAALYARVAPVL